MINLCLFSVTTLLPFIFFWNPIIPSVNGYKNPESYLIGDVAINCGYHGNSTALDGRQWFGDTGSRSVMSMLQPKGKSRTSTADHRTLFADPIPYMTARVSATQFYYTFQVNAGQKFIRLHFHPSSYCGFEKSEDFFTVKAGAFTLLRNFSASLDADALGVKYLVKEFVLNVEENNYLNLTFSPSQNTKQRNIYAFVNGIEIISMPTGLYYTPDGDLGARVVGQNNRYFVDNSTALEMVQRLNIGGSSISPVEDFGMFRRWSEDVNHLLESKPEPVNHLVRGIKYTGIQVFAAPLKIYQTSWKTGKNGRPDKVHDFTWKIPVHLGFGYLVRLHFCDFGLEMTEGSRREFNVLINNQTAETKVDVFRLSGRSGVPIYRDYMVMVKGNKEAGKCDLLIALQSSDELVIGLLHGLEIFKLSNPDNSLASPNPAFQEQVSTSWNLKIQNLHLALGRKNAIATCMTIIIISLNIIVFKLRQIWEETSHEEKDTRSASSEQSCCRFSLAEIISATQNFSDALLIGKGGFGNVYKGYISGSSEMVALKRLKWNSKQGAREFWTEIETLSKIRHIHLVSLIGYCNEFQEMILVYEYMPRGTLADNLYRIGRNGKDGTPLTWDQRLRICIGAARGLDYLHTGIKFGVIHRDVKDSNILLDENLVAKISDFGLSRLGNLSESQGNNVSTNVKGTFGYLDPDYIMTHKPTRKTDIYAFGVVMLIVLCGRPAVDRRIPSEPQSLLFLFRECLTKGDIDDIVDPSLQGKISSDSLNEFIKSVENCLHPQPKKRPTMSQLVTSLECALEQQQSAKPSKSEESVVVGQPCDVGIIQTFEVNEYGVPPVHQESAISSPGEGITSNVIQNAELQTRREDSLSKRKAGWIQKALRKIRKPLKERRESPSEVETICCLHERASCRFLYCEPASPFSTSSKEKDLFSEDGRTCCFTTSSKENDLFLEDGPTSRFTISQIRAATDNFSFYRKIIDDIYWVVYMGFIEPLQKKYTIYQLKEKLYDEHLKEFSNELEILLQLRHSNLLSMVGYCYHENEVFIVYEYVGNTTLRSCLYDTSHAPLSWIDRIRICIGVAEGLKYLHRGTGETRIHGHLRPESILFESGPKNLPKEWTPVLSTFGFSRLSTISIPYLAWSSTMNTFVGAKVPWWEYFPPDCLIFGPQFTEKSDVYSFGLVLLEVLCRRRPAYSNSLRVDESYLKTWVVKRGIKTKTLHDIIDSSLMGQISQTCLSEFLKIAFSCLHDQATERPTMGYVVESLKFALQLQLEDGEGHDFENVYQEMAKFQLS